MPLERDRRTDDAPEPQAPLLTVLMPVYNERATLPEALQRVLAAPVDKEVLVVDDGSTDGTREYLRAEVDGRLPGVRVIYLERNGGKGTAIRAALSLARGEFVVVQDADLEYDPADLPALLEPAQAGATVVYGTRFRPRTPRMRLPNLVVNRLLAWMVRVLYGCPLTDEATCYKLFLREAILSVPLTCRRFEFCPEVTAKLLRRGHRIVEVPVRYEARTMAQGKKIRWTDAVTAIWTLLRYRWWR
ncbi:MAG TPA: glycosyltransferase family 2 protein [Chthonomonadales bacterium]|nr:glycosyltransferase family 2 protein [Chthonomonadales bacterium]